ncbi:Uma2 family endonuclease [Actinocrinis puniceicyclus]|uniref:Uma2 family endonuclease n=1 Tax=Actinocrinis puniceicyclus TaxID=977794 RepID=A0A8J8BDM2_9ACTN|nr:Uma2 family endonuclease [Actinocrinis puniceicyclus]MBS2964311.1 Uma2 family endonuclease [Actinocrinis puniceicyclus]
MSLTTDLLNKVIEEVLPDTVRAEIIDGELIVNAATPFNRHAFAVSHLRDAIGLVPGLIALEMTTVFLPATDEEFIPDLAYYRYDELDPDVWLNPASALVMAVEVVSGKDNGNAARRDREDKARGYAASGVPLYLLIDKPRKMALLQSTPRYVPDAKASRYSVTIRTSYGELLELPEPFNRTIDTSIFER